MAWGNPKFLKELQDYLLGILGEVEKDCHLRPAWMFLCCAAMLEYLAKVGVDQSSTSDWKAYMTFVEKYMPGYRTFEYLTSHPSYDNAGTQITTKSDLPLQMYCILRCGLVHSFSLTPNPKYTSKKPGKLARQRSITLTHREEGEAGLSNLDNYKGQDGTLDSARLVLQDFIADIRMAMRGFFQDARNDSQLRAQIRANLRKVPPLKIV